MQSKKIDVVVKSDGAIYRGVRLDRAWVWEWICDVSTDSSCPDQRGNDVNAAKRAPSVGKLK